MKLSVIAVLACLALVPPVSADATTPALPADTRFYSPDPTPSDVAAYVEDVVDAANNNGSVPALVAYNVPGRDCGYYSGGGWTGGPSDPVYGIEDPTAGAWFRKTALQMANNAIPAFP